MRFALLGDHPDGLGMARALVASGRHQLLLYCGPGQPMEARRVGDVEEVLADPFVELVIVASPLADRPAQLRRSLQSERHVLCVQPAGDSPAIGYEAAMIRRDTGCVLIPLLPQARHPGFVRLAELARGPLGPVRLIEEERETTHDATLYWDVWRLLGGEIAEVSAYSAHEAIDTNEPLLLAGRYTGGGLLRALLLPGQRDDRWRVVGAAGRAELIFAQARPGPARLTWYDTDGLREESWEAWDPWPPLVEAFETALAANADAEAPWRDAIHGLELDDAVRRSVERRRAYPLEYPDATEEAGFKGMMTLVGCGLLWGVLFLVMLSAWRPWLGWLIVPLLVGFLGLQLLRWVLPKKGT